MFAGNIIVALNPTYNYRVYLSSFMSRERRKVSFNIRKTCFLNEISLNDVCTTNCIINLDKIHNQLTCSIRFFTELIDRNFIKIEFYKLNHEFKDRSIGLNANTESVPLWSFSQTRNNQILDLIKFINSQVKWR